MAQVIHPMSSSLKQTVDKEKISRILDIEPDIDVHQDDKQTIYILNGDVYQVDMKKDQLELTKVNTFSRKRTKSIDSLDAVEVDAPEKPLFGKKDVIYIDRQEGDSLQKLAVTFNCTIAEIKFANKIYNEQELHALRTVKVPVVKDGVLYDKYKNEIHQQQQEDGMDDELCVENVNEFTSDDVDSKYKFRVHEPYAIDPHLHSLSDEEDDEEDDIYDVRDHLEGETVHLLEDRTVFVNKKHAGYPVNICESTLTEFMNKIDEKIQKDVDEVECKNENLEEVVSSLDKQVVFPMGDRSTLGSRDKYGQVCSLTWKHFVLIICLVAVIVPTFYFIHYKHERESHHSAGGNVTRPPRHSS